MKKKLLAVGIIGVLMASMLVGCSYETEETQYTDEIKNQMHIPLHRESNSA